MNARHEVFEQTGGEGKLEVRGGDLEIALWLDGAPLIYDAADCAGSVGRFTCLLDNARPEIAATIERAAASGFAEEAPLSQQIEPLLRLLPNGKYRLELAPMRAASLTYAFDDYFDSGFQCYYPYAHLPGYVLADVYLGTQPESSLSDNRVNEYLEILERGGRPSLISLGAREREARFILDGHHKLMAYWCCGVRPVVLHIEAERMTPIPYDLARQTLAHSSATDLRSYLRAKSAKGGRNSKFVHDHQIVVNAK